MTFVLSELEAIKKPHTKLDYGAGGTKEGENNLQELMQCIDDPMYFMQNFMTIKHSLRGAIPFHLFPYQIRLVNAFQNYRFNCVLAGRQTGKTECAVGYILWKSMFTPDVTVLITANNFGQALEIMSRIRYSYESIPSHIKAGVTKYNEGSITFDNGSRIISKATTPNAGRGLSITLLYVDEFAAIQPRMAKNFWAAVRPVLSTGGSCIITSTPQNDEDQFAQIWKSAIDVTDDFGNVVSDVGSNGFHGILVPWHEHPDRDENWAKTERGALGEAKFRQEHCCEFVTDSETLINPLTLSRLKTTEPQFYIDQSRWYHEPEPNKAYLVALDPSLGTNHDYAAIQVFQLPEMIQIAEWQSNNLAARLQVVVLRNILMALEDILREHPDQNGPPDIWWTFENNTIGEGVLTVVEDTGEERFPGQLVTEPRRKGIQMKRIRRGLNTTSKSKLSACARLKSLIESDRMHISSANLLKELKNFAAVGNTFKANLGEHDDLTMATLMVVRMLDIVAKWGTNIGELKETIHDDELYEEAPMPVLIGDGLHVV